VAASYTVEVRNSDFDSTNRIHGDEVARAHGFRGGLVPGVVTYAHMCPAVVVALGSEWIERGETEVRFTKPVYDGDALEVASELTETGAAVRARNAAGEEVAVLTASLPAPRPRPTEPSGLRLTPLHATLTAEEASPAGLLRLANRFVTSHFDISPWIHAGSRVLHQHELAPGAEAEVQGALASLSERGGHKLFELDLVVHAGGGPAAQVRHTVIYEIAPRRGPARR
jgi:MaoC dehydratase-like protein